jgi:acyl-coenzyme A thioesterase PaaI-like protein
VQQADDEILRFPPESGCFGCSSQNDAGLQLTFRRRGEEIQSDYTIPDRFHGAPGNAHGGIVATIFDELSCAAVFFLRSRHVVTGELTVRYAHPCPVETELHFQARIADESHGRYAIVVATAMHEGVRVAMSTGKFFYVERTLSAP